MTLTSQILLIAPSSASRIGPYCGLVAALLTRMSSRPVWRITSATTRLAGRGVADVPGHGDRQASRGDDLRGRRLACVRMPGVERDRRPRLGERRGDGEPDAPAPTGDQGDTAVEGEPLSDAHAQLRLEVPAWSFERTSMRSRSAASRRSRRRHAASRSAVPSISSRR